MVHNHPKHPGYVLHQMMFLTFGFHGLLEGTLVPKHFVIDPSSRNWWIIPQFYLLGWGWEFRHKSTTLIEGVFFGRNLTPTQNNIWVIFFAGFTEIASGADFKWNKNARNKSFLYPVTNGALWAAGISQSLESGVGEKELMTVKVTPLSTFFFSELLTVTAPLLSYGALKCMLSFCVSFSEIMWGTSNPVFLADAKALVWLRAGSCGTVTFMR